VLTASVISIPIPSPAIRTTFCIFFFMKDKDYGNNLCVLLVL
jgi:hypothetical protein